MNTNSDVVFSAGSRDSPLTNHGVIQAKQLGDYLAKARPRLSHVFASPLQRAVKTAIGVQSAQAGGDEDDMDLVLPIVQSKDLAEQDFGFYEGKPFYARSADSTKTGREIHYEAHKDTPGFQDVESKESLAARCDSFLDEHLMPLLDFDGVPSELSVVIVSHGILLSNLWRAILRRLPRKSVTIMPEIVAAKGQIVLEHLGGWSNTGFLELLVRHSLLEYAAVSDESRAANQAESNDRIGDAAIQSPSKGAIEEISTEVAPKPDTQDLPTVSDTDSGRTSSDAATALVVAAQSPALLSSSSPPQAPPGGFSASSSAPLQGYNTTILTVNGQEHLRGVKRTRGGIGSARHDDSQKSIQTFFKKAKNA
ncbi:hypothetical protein MBLNU457_4855t1 [Dothideomycetes sp. NU457]